MLDRKKFFDGIRNSPFHGLSTDQVDGINHILDAWDKWAPDSDVRWIAYSLATAYHETNRTMQPIAEIGHGHGRSYGIPSGPWKKVYYGRGDVQLTWYKNYVFATKKLQALGVLTKEQDLAKNPELAMDPSVAGAIIVRGMIEGWFTGKKLSQFYTAKRSDNVGARKIINGTDRAKLIAGYALQFLDAMD